MISRQCINCIHRLGSPDHEGRPTCLAFPEGIPEGIITGDIDHSVPIEGDHGFQYNPIDPSLDEPGD